MDKKVWFLIFLVVVGSSFALRPSQGGSLVNGLSGAQSIMSGSSPSMRGAQQGQQLINGFQDPKGFLQQFLQGQLGQALQKGGGCEAEANSEQALQQLQKKIELGKFTGDSKIIKSIQKEASELYKAIYGDSKEACSFVKKFKEKDCITDNPTAKDDGFPKREKAGDLEKQFQNLENKKANDWCKKVPTKEPFNQMKDPGKTESKCGSNKYCYEYGSCLNEKIKKPYEGGSKIKLDSSKYNCEVKELQNPFCICIMPSPNGCSMWQCIYSGKVQDFENGKTSSSSYIGISENPSKEEADKMAKQQATQMAKALSQSCVQTVKQKCNVGAHDEAKKITNDWLNEIKSSGQHINKKSTSGKEDKYPIPYEELKDCNNNWVLEGTSDWEIKYTTKQLQEIGKEFGNNMNDQEAEDKGLNDIKMNLEVIAPQLAIDEWKKISKDKIKKFTKEWNELNKDGSTITQDKLKKIINLFSTNKISFSSKSPFKQSPMHYFRSYIHNTHSDTDIKVQRENIDPIWWYNTLNFNLFKEKNKDGCGLEIKKEDEEKKGYKIEDWQDAAKWFNQALKKCNINPRSKNSLFNAAKNIACGQMGNMAQELLQKLMNGGLQQGADGSYNHNGIEGNRDDYMLPGQDELDQVKTCESFNAKVIGLGQECLNEIIELNDSICCIGEPVDKKIIGDSSQTCAEQYDKYNICSKEQSCKGNWSFSKDAGEQCCSGNCINKNVKNPTTEQFDDQTINTNGVESIIYDVNENGAVVVADHSPDGEANGLTIRNENSEFSQNIQGPGYLAENVDVTTDSYKNLPKIDNQGITMNPPPYTDDGKLVSSTFANTASPYHWGPARSGDYNDLHIGTRKGRLVHITNYNNYEQTSGTWINDYWYTNTLVMRSTTPGSGGKVSFDCSETNEQNKICIRDGDYVTISATNIAGARIDLAGTNSYESVYFYDKPMGGSSLGLDENLNSNTMRNYVIDGKDSYDYAVVGDKVYTDAGEIIQDSHKPKLTPKEALRMAKVTP